MADIDLSSVYQPKRSSKVHRAGRVLRYGYDSCHSLLVLFDAWAEVGGKRGVRRHDQQDLLRAMVVFAGAALDSSLKWLIRDALPELLERGDTAAQSAFEGYAQNQLANDPKEMARLLTLASPRDGIIQNLVTERTKNSLQSWQELSTVAGYFGVVKEIGYTVGDVRPAFECRNLIAHELDVDFGSSRPTNRRQHSRNTLVDYANVLLGVTSNLVEAVDRRLGAE